AWENYRRWIHQELVLQGCSPAYFGVLEPDFLTYGFGDFADGSSPVRRWLAYAIEKGHISYSDLPADLIVKQFPVDPAAAPSAEKTRNPASNPFTRVIRRVRAAAQPTAEPGIVP